MTIQWQWKYNYNTMTLNRCNDMTHKEDSVWQIRLVVSQIWATQYRALIYNTMIQWHWKYNDNENTMTIQWQWKYNYNTMTLNRCNDMTHKEDSVWQICLVVSQIWATQYREKIWKTIIIQWKWKYNDNDNTMTRYRCLWQICLVESQIWAPQYRERLPERHNTQSAPFNKIFSSFTFCCLSYPDCHTHSSL